MIKSNQYEGTSMKKMPIQTIKTLKDFATFADYSFINSLNKDPQSSQDGDEHSPREVFSGHYVLVTTTPIKNPYYIAHSKKLFQELGLDDSLVHDKDFIKMFSGNLSHLPTSMSKVGWACGYALSIFGTEYYEQCPFGSGNGYGDGRAISVFEGVFNDKRWEMQLKGAGRTPYCRGADGRAVLRSSVREFLAQEHMAALGVPTSRSLSLYTSKTEKVRRPWYSQDSYSKDPDRVIYEDVAISTRVASSFIRVGQIELFARRARKKEHSKAIQELEQIVLHLINREYNDLIQKTLPLKEKVILLAEQYCDRLTSLVANWIRVGYCQGNFNSDNCAAGGFTLDYGPFGFCDLYDPLYQPWTGGGQHFAFLNQAIAAERNFYVFYTSLQQLLLSDEKYLLKLEQIKDQFSFVMQEKMQTMWAEKLGLQTFDIKLFKELQHLMDQTIVDYTIFFRELSHIPKNLEPLKKSFYNDISKNKTIQNRWENWLENWNRTISNNNSSEKEISQQMIHTNPKYTLREWILVPAYEKAKQGDYSLVQELQEVMSDPYSEQSKEIEKKYYKLKPSQFFEIGGISHISCSS